MSPEEIFKTMQKLIVEQFALDPDEVTMDSSFEEDLGADSVDLVELVMAMEEEFELDEIPEEELTSLLTPIRNQATEIETLNKEVATYRLNEEHLNEEHKLREEAAAKTAKRAKPKAKAAKVAKPKKAEKAAKSAKEAK